MSFSHGQLRKGLSGVEAYMQGGSSAEVVVVVMGGCEGGGKGLDVGGGLRAGRPSLRGAPQAWKWHPLRAPPPAGGPAAACPVPAGHSNVSCTCSLCYPSTARP